MKTMESPKFNLNDVKYADGAALFSRAEALFRGGKVQGVREDIYGYSAVVHGGEKYEVSISRRHVDKGSCGCYMGQNDMLCKHMLALALAVLDMTGGLTPKPPPRDLKEAKKEVSAGMRKLRPYTGPSNTWFSYQRGLATGAGIIIDAVRALSATEESADYLWDTVLRISNKLATSGIDDSDGIVGNCVDELVQQLGDYAKKAPELKPAMLAYCADDTGFGFEDDLRASLEKT